MLMPPPVFGGDGRREEENGGSAAEAAREGDGEAYDEYLDFGGDEGLTVTAAPETTGQVTVITREEIERRNVRDLASLLEEALDMGVTRYGGYGNQTELGMRGFDTGRIAILIDGVPANSPRSGEFDVGRIDIAAVERIEVLYGGSDTKYNVSGALGGVINIVTARKQKPGLALGGTVSNTGYLPGRYNRRHAGGAAGGPQAEDLFDMQSLSLSAGYGAAKHSWNVSLFGNRAGNHYLYRDDYGFARRKTGNEVLDTGGNVSFTAGLSGLSSLVSDTKWYYAEREFPVTPDSTGSAPARDFSVTESLLFNAPVIFREDLGTEASLTYQYAAARYGVGVKNFDHHITGINRWNWYPNETWTLRSGIDGRFLYVDAGSGTETGPVKTGGLGGLYVTGEFSPVKGFMITASLKGVTDTKRGAAVPKLGFRWEAAPGFTLKNNYFRSFKFPGFDDLYYRSLDNMFVGNPELKPEDGLGADLTGEFAPEGIFGMNVTVYAQWTEDSIHWVKSAGGRWSPENTGAAWIAGADVRPVLTLPFAAGGPVQRLKLGLTWQFQLNWLLSGSLSFADGYRIPYMPTHIVGGSVDLQWRTGSLLLSAHYETTRYADTSNQMALAPYCIVHATCNQGIGRYFTAFASLRNILNARYESFAGYHMPGISLTVGLRMNFEGGKSPPVSPPAGE
jgi:vitamin B12 transporter